jgi:hypothetical protein
LQTHAVTEVLNAGEKLLAGQAEHASVLMVLLYSFMPHGMHVPADGVRPAGQMQTMVLSTGAMSHCTHSCEAIVAVYLPDTQAVQLSEPVDGLYVPTAHAVHDTDPVYPAAQTQAVKAVLASGEIILAGQGVHSTTLA